MDHTVAITELVTYTGEVWRVRVLLFPEDCEGDAGEGWNAIACDLPGCGTCADTFDECLENFREAAEGSIESYLMHGEEIPWDNDHGRRYLDGIGIPYHERHITIDRKTLNFA